MKDKILSSFLLKKATGHKSLSVLIDPDKTEDPVSLLRLINKCMESKVDYFFVGGSLIHSYNLRDIIQIIKENSNIPVILFPGSNLFIEFSADALLFLSLISGRNSEFLIGQHVTAAPILKSSNLEILATGYILIDSGEPTSVSYMSNTTPIPGNKPSIAAATAIAGEMLGLKLIYLEAGSGAKNPVSEDMIRAVRASVELPLIVGGGLNTAIKAMAALEAGADMVVIGNGIEKNPNLVIEVSDKIYAYNESLNIH